MTDTLVWQDFVEPDSLVEIEHPDPDYKPVNYEIDFDLLADPKVNELIRQDIKKNLLDNIDNNENIADTVIGCALTYLMAAAKDPYHHPWTIWNNNAGYLSDYFEVPDDTDGDAIWEATHPGFKMPRSYR